MSLAVLAMSLSLTPVFAQNQDEKNKETEARVKALVENRAFVFVANSAQPLNATEISRVMSQMQGAGATGQINLNEQGYQVTFSKELIKSILPYYGRAYSAPIGSSEKAGYNFESKDFSMSEKKNKKGDNLMTFNLKDHPESIRMELTVSKSGNAFLTINSNSRQSITYTGYLKGI